MTAGAQDTGSLHVSGNTRRWVGILVGGLVLAAGIIASARTVGHDEAATDGRVAAVETQVASESKARTSSEARLTKALEDVAGQVQAMRSEVSGELRKVRNDFTAMRDSAAADRRAVRDDFASFREDAARRFERLETAATLRGLFNPLPVMPAPPALRSPP